MEDLYEQQALLGDVPDFRLQAHHDMAAVLAEDVQRGRKSEVDADIILTGMRTWLWRNRFPEPDDDEPIAA